VDNYKNGNFDVSDVTQCCYVAGSMIVLPLRPVPQSHIKEHEKILNS
jgi:hypothetical protein